MDTDNATSPAGEVADGGALPSDATENTKPRYTPPADDADGGETEADKAEDTLDEAETEENEDGEKVLAEEIEFDFGGTKFKVAKGTPVDDVAEQLQKYAKGIEADYTRKTQETAAQRKSAEEALKITQRLMTLKTEQAAVYAEGVKADQEIRELSKYDLGALWQSNPDQARMISDRLAQATYKYRQVESTLAQYGEALNQADREFTQARSKEGEAVVAKAIKGWNAQTEADVIAYAVKTYGISETDAKNWRLNPPAVIAMHKAMLWDRMQAKATKPAPAPDAPKAPVTPIKAPPSKTTKTLSDLAKGDNVDEWARMRNAQLAKQRRAR
jgi:hypothetical protein